MAKFLLTIIMLQINAVPLYETLVASVAMLILAYKLTRRTPTDQLRHQKMLDGAGLLQWTYILGQTGALPEHVFRVKKPTAPALRRAGLRDRWHGNGMVLPDRRKEEESLLSTSRRASTADLSDK